ncbi:MAG: hypothetical protein K8H88_01980 [Sandaracinaceae bacterium]|nr:hypothetical protein [Sandaracinaceae bacterium]
MTEGGDHVHTRQVDPSDTAARKRHRACRFALGLFVGISLLSLPAAAQLGQCRVNGVPVRYVPQINLGDIAMARLGPSGEPIVLYDPMVTQRAGPTISTFFYYHECAHHILGHVMNGAMGFVRPLVDEQEADCWAIRYLRESGILSLAQLREIQAGLAQSPGDWTHLPGPRRALNLEGCLGISPGLGPGPGGPRCRTVTTYETRLDFEVRVVPQQIPCQHCGCRPMMGCGCRHAFDVVPNQVRVPVERRVPVTRQVCD